MLYSEALPHLDSSVTALFREAVAAAAAAAVAAAFPVPAKPTVCKRVEWQLQLLLLARSFESADIYSGQIVTSSSSVATSSLLL
jgi:hypothetical protein